MNYILIIDDDKWYGQSIANMLDVNKVALVNTPEEAIVMIDENIPDMIYLDFNLGVKNGLTVLNELQSWTDTRKVPIILLSSDGKRLNIDDWRNYGVVGILDKIELTSEKLNNAWRNYGKYSN